MVKAVVLRLPDQSGTPPVAALAVAMYLPHRRTTAHDLTLARA
jgi:hypothetical protein